MDQWIRRLGTAKTKVAPGWTSARPMHDKLTLILQHNTIYLDNPGMDFQKNLELEELDEYSAMKLERHGSHRHRTTIYKPIFVKRTNTYGGNSWPGNTCSDTAGLWPGFFGRKHVRWNFDETFTGGTGELFSRAGTVQSSGDRGQESDREAPKRWHHLSLGYCFSDGSFVIMRGSLRQLIWLTWMPAHGT